MAKENEVALIDITEARKVAVFNDPNEFDGLLKQIREKVSELKADTSTAKGRDEIRSMAFKVTRTKTSIDEAGKILKADWQKKVDAIDASRKRMRDTLDELASTTRAPLTAWEDADKSRIELHEKMIRDMKDMADVTYGEAADNIRTRIKNLKAYHPGDNDYEEFQDKAEARYAASSNILKIALESAENREREAAEFAELRKSQAEQAERIRKENAERERAEIERMREEETARRKERAEADAERLAAEQKARAQQAEIDRLTREKAEADRKAAAAEERAQQQAAEEKRRKQMEADRLATEKKAAEENEARIKKAKALRQQWQGEAQDDLYKALGDKKDVGAAVKAIIDGKIRHVTFG